MLLKSTIGTKREEDKSFASANHVCITITASMVVLCSLEILMYYLYNRKVISIQNCTRRRIFVDSLD